MSGIISYIKDQQSRSIGALFLLNAVLMGNWAVRIPDIKAHLQINDEELGLALLASPLGIILFTPLTTWCINRFGTGRVAVVSAVICSLTIILMGMPNTWSQLAGALFFFGIGNGALDISINGVVNAIEKSQKRVIMSTSHGFWSLGAGVASLIAGWIAGFHIHYFYHFMGVAVIGLSFVFATYRTIGPIRDHTESALRWVWPGWQLVLLICIVFLVFIAEGGVIDWTALYYKEVIGMPVAWVGLGFFGFSATMALFRFLGDGLIAKYSARVLLRVGIFLSSLGLLILGLNTSWVICTLALMLIGAATSILVPIVFREAGSSRVVAPSLGLALVATLGYAGFLIGPPIIGFISEAYDLGKSFVFLSLLMALAGVLSLGLRSVE